MSNHPKEQAADLLEKAAAYITALEEQRATYVARDSKLASKKMEKRASKLNDAYQSVTGSSLEPDVLQKLSQDPKVAAAIEKLAAPTTSSNLGAAVSRRGAVSSADAADQAFINFLTE